MKSTNKIEFTAGLFLVLGIFALIFLAMQATDGGATRGGSYQVVAYFHNVGSLKPRAQVRMGGVSVGMVEEIELDPETLEARVVLAISDRYRDLPDDTTASILTSGILGDQYVGLEPGGSPEPLNPGDRIMFTNSAMVLEQLIGKYLLGTDGGER